MRDVSWTVQEDYEEERRGPTLDFELAPSSFPPFRFMVTFIASSFVIVM